MNPTDLAQAAFWEQLVCLDCGSTFEHPADVAGQPRCPNCHSDTIYSAKFIQRCFDFIEADNG